MPAPKIGRSLDAKPESEPVEAPEPAPVNPVLATVPDRLTIDSPEMQALEQPDIYDYVDLTLAAPDAVMPRPTPLILKYCEQHELMWRWFSEPMVDKEGMREWTAFSPNGAMRDEIRFQGGANPHGLRVSVDNRVMWKHDAFLGVIKRRRYDAKRAMKKKLTDEQTKSTQHPSAELQSAAQRLGGKISDFSVSIEERRFKTEDDASA